MRIGILGAGSWPIAMSVLLTKRNHSVCLWEFDPKEAAKLSQQRELPTKLPGIRIADQVVVTNALSEVFTDADYIISTVPTQATRATMQRIRETIPRQQLDMVRAWIIASKGIEHTTLSLLSDILMQEIPGLTYKKVVILSGPSHAEEVSRDIPTTVVAASKNNELAVEIQTEVSTDTFRIYTNNDVVGVELCASVKNVIAIAAGFSDGLGFGDNTKGALLTRGIVEMARLGKKLGADEMTFTGLAGFGDLVTTCTSRHSRNRKIGELIASGLSLSQALAQMTMIAEGVETTRAVYNLAQKLGIVMPITTEVYNTLFMGKSPLSAVRDLMVRQLKPERI
ncbi:MAG: NAD(P)-dependent glycerol-3-phosphate dehydrogenase [Chitinivibrionales bacterium]|nr:NAD(P)-dependent glycerol-3-phosphate dehydrogenase [Chitinivibrionales bacterium]